MFVDEELQGVAVRLGALWQRRDVCQHHDHWMRSESRQMPAFLAMANSPKHWQESQALFNRRKAAGFPGHEPAVRVAA